VNIRVEATFLAGVHAVLREVVAVVCCVKNVGVIQLASSVELLHHGLNHLIYSLKRPEARPLKLIIILNDSLIETGQLLHPADAALDLRVKILGAGDLIVLEQVGVPLCVSGDVHGKLWRQIDSAVGGNGCVSKEPGLVTMRQSLIKELVRKSSCDVGRVLAAIVDGRCAIVSDSGIAILVCVGIQEERGCIEAASKWLIVVVSGVVIPQLARIVRVVASVLEPDREVIIVDTLFDDLGISAVGRPDVGDLNLNEQIRAEIMMKNSCRCKVKLRQPRPRGSSHLYCARLFPSTC
jgi:hypothetical protein